MKRVFGAVGVFVVPSLSRLSGCALAVAVHFGAVGVAAAAPASSSDVVGIKLGGTADQAKRAIQAIGPGWSFAVAKTDTGKLDTLSATRQTKSGSQMAELVLVKFNANTGAVWYVGHEIAYEQGARPLVSAVVDGYLQKFGPPSFAEPHPDLLGGSDPTVLWSRDASGQPLKSTRRNSTRCVGDEGWDVPGTIISGNIPVGAPGLSYPSRVPDDCGFTAYAHVTRDANRDVVFGMAVWIADMHSRYSELLQEQTAAANKNALDHANANKQASGIKPKL